MTIPDLIKTVLFCPIFLCIVIYNVWIKIMEHSYEFSMKVESGIVSTVSYLYQLVVLMSFMSTEETKHMF